MPIVKGNWKGPLKLQVSGCLLLVFEDALVVVDDFLLSRERGRKELGTVCFARQLIAPDVLLFGSAKELAVSQSLGPKPLTT